MEKAIIKGHSSNDTILPLTKGAFVLSLDTEFAWGDADLPKKRYEKGQKRERELTFRLLKLLEKYKIPATFAVVGQLYEKASKEKELPKETKELLSRNWPDRLYIDTFASQDFHALDLMEAIEKDSLSHEMGSHSTTHIIFTSPECTEEIANWEFESARELAYQRGYSCSSFVFPRNQCNYLNSLAQAGFKVYRGEDPAWFNEFALGKWGKKIGHILDLALAFTPPCSSPFYESNGLLNLPGSMNYLSMAGWRRYIPLACRVQQAKKGIKKAIKEKKLFHLWFHPSHLGDETERLFSGLETIFACVAQKREQGELDVYTMGGLYKHLAPAILGH